MRLDDGRYVVAIAKCIESVKLLCITKPVLTHVRSRSAVLTERSILPSAPADEVSLKQLAVRRSSMDNSDRGRLKASEIDLYACSDSGSGIIAL
jgi:hypothetical protein